MFTPTSAATSRVRNPSKPRSAIWLKAARTSASRRSSRWLFAGRTGAKLTPSIKHLIEPLAAFDPAPALARAPGLDHQPVARIIQMGEHHLTEVAAAEGYLRRVSRVARNAPTTDHAFATPAAWLLV